jgi:RNA polymerase sigma factor (sigma-70 family)
MTRLLYAVARHHRLTPENAEDFVQSSHVRLLERNYDVFDRFTGRSSLHTYLTVVATRLLLDWRNHEYGKWRPSAAAGRLGERAITLERLMYRDWRTLGEAIEVMCAADKAVLRRDLERIAARLPVRRPVEEVGGIEGLEELAATGFDDPVETRERQRNVQAISRLLARAIAQLPIEEQDLLRSRFVNRRTVPNLARVLNTESGALYRRISRLLQQLRRALEEAGVTGPEGLNDSGPAWSTSSGSFTRGGKR